MFTVFVIQSNLCTTATLGTPKKWPLFRGWPLFRVWSKILGKVIIGLVGQGIWAGRCWQVAVVQRWSLAQVWLYWQNLLTPLNSYKWHFQILKWMHNPYFCHTHKVEKYCLSCECLILIHLYNSYGNILKHWKDIYVFQFFYKILNRMRRP
jgi:hypothetical protein